MRKRQVLLHPAIEHSPPLLAHASTLAPWVLLP